MGETLGISLSAKTGTPDFDSTSGHGKDTSADDLVIRTNDLIEYNISVVANGGTAEKPVVTLTLPQGQEVRDVPAWCDDASGADAKPSPLLPAPAVPLTNTSWQSLPTQTLTCHIPDMASNVTQVLTVPVWQRSEVPNGTTVPTAVATINSQAAPNPVSSTENLSMTASAAPKWDVRKNGIGIEENKGYSYQNFRACSWDTSRKCHLRSYSILVGAAAGGKGLAPFTGDVTFQDDLTPEKFFGADVVNSAAWKAAGADAVNKYAPRLVGCETRPRFHMSPGNNTGDLTESVRNSGTVSCEQPEPGKAAKVTISNADWSLYTYPDKVSAPAARPVIPDNTAYAVSSIINVEVPVDAITDLGVKVNTTTSLKIRNEFTNLQGNGLDGTPQQAGRIR